MLEKGEIMRKVQNKEFEIISEKILRNNIRFFAPFLDPKVLSPFSRKTMRKYIRELRQKEKEKTKT